MKGDIICKIGVTVLAVLATVVLLLDRNKRGKDHHAVDDDKKRHS